MTCVRHPIVVRSSPDRRAFAVPSPCVRRGIVTESPAGPVGPVGPSAGQPVCRRNPASWFPRSRNQAMPAGPRSAVGVWGWPAQRGPAGGPESARFGPAGLVAAGSVLPERRAGSPGAFRTLSVISRMRACPRKQAPRAAGRVMFRGALVPGSGIRESKIEIRRIEICFQKKRKVVGYVRPTPAPCTNRGGMLHSVGRGPVDRAANRLTAGRLGAFPGRFGGGWGRFRGGLGAVGGVLRRIFNRLLTRSGRNRTGFGRAGLPGRPLPGLCGLPGSPALQPGPATLHPANRMAWSVSILTRLRVQKPSLPAARYGNRHGGLEVLCSCNQAMPDADPDPGSGSADPGSPGNGPAWPCVQL